MNPYPRFLRLLVALASIAGLLVACQDVSSDQQETGQLKAYANFSIPDSFRLPDTTTWSTKTDSGSGILHSSKSATSNTIDFSYTISLKDALGTDTLHIQLWTLGVQTTVADYLQDGRNQKLRFYKSHSDTIAIRLLSDFDKLCKSAPDSFVKLGRIKASNLIDFYASRLLAHDDAYSDFPSSVPTGMPLDSIKKSILVQSAHAGVTWKQLTPFGFDSVSVHSALLALVQSKALPAADTLVLFPPYPVRILTSLSIPSRLVTGQPAVSVSGAFAWSKGRPISSPRISITSIQGVDPFESPRVWRRAPDLSHTFVVDPVVA
jgi:hypothetical protein